MGRSKFAYDLMTLDPERDTGADLIEIYGRRSGFRET
jgi:hypothetical protein